MNALVKEFQAERLTKFADWLIRQGKVKASTCAVSDSNNLWIVDGKLTGTISFFYGPILAFPEIFPDDWAEDNNHVYLKTAPDFTTIHSVMEYFGLTYQQIGHIFIPECQKPMLFGGNILTTQALGIHLAKNIYALIESQKVIVSFIDQLNANYSKN